LNLGGHLVGFNKDLLEYYLVDSGFVNLQTKNFDDCSKVFDRMDIERYKTYSLYMEAEK